MASARATTLAQGFSNRLLLEMYDISLLDYIVNRDYEGEINKVGSVLNILNLARITEKNYTGANLSPDDLYENNCVLTIEKRKSFYWRELTIDNWESYIKDPHSTVVNQKADERNKNMDLYVLAFFGDVGAGNRVGTDVTGNITSIDAAGAVVGSGTSFDSSYVGRGFKATGHTTWYRVKAVADATHLTIEDDFDDITSAYTGGVIGAVAFTVEAVTPLSINTSNLLSSVGKLKLKLDMAEKNGYNSVPDSDRWLIVPPEFEDIATNGATGITLHVPEVYDELIKKGMVTMLKGFKVFRSNRLSGDNTNGYHCLAGHKFWITFAEKLLSAVIEEDLTGNFGSAFKDLYVYGAKVPDSRRHMAAELFATFSV